MLTSHNPNSSYQVGGSLPFNAPTYVRRQADETLFQGLLRGEFCYVFNARQMGKSSLRVQTTHRLQAKGIRCGVIDITAIGTQEVVPEQWYGSIVGLLAKAFKLEVNLLNWWRYRTHLSFVNRLSDFLDTVLLPQIPEPIIIFIDEIDSVLSLNFSTNDFFALIRACYNRRAEQAEYRRLTFALFGVATPANLISDATRTPFNIGQEIELRGFQLTEATPLLSGLSETILAPKTALQCIIRWTGGQPFLTQKLCQLAAQSTSEFSCQEGQSQTVISCEFDSITQNGAGTGALPLQLKTQNFIDCLVQTHIINNWEAQDEPEHLKAICDRLLYSEQRAGRLLGLYQKILLHSSSDADSNPESERMSEKLLLTRLPTDAPPKSPLERETLSGSVPPFLRGARGDRTLSDISQTSSGGIAADNSPEQTELILTGLVEKREGILQIKNPIYQKIFNFDWVAQQLANLRPY